METEEDIHSGRNYQPLSEQPTFWAMLLHLSVFTGSFTFVGFILGPIVVWLIQKEQFPELTSHLKEAVNFQISMLLYTIVLLLLVIVTFGLGILIALPGLLILSFLDFILVIVAAIQARDGVNYRYPMTIRFF